MWKKIILTTKTECIFLKISISNYNLVWILNSDIDVLIMLSGKYSRQKDFLYDKYSLNNGKLSKFESLLKKK